MNETQKRTMRNAYHIIKLDKDIWDDITAFTQDYSNLDIMTCAANITEQYNDMDKAYEAICKYTDDIHLIKITASKGEEHIEIKFTNDDLSSTYLQEFSYECYTDNERKLRNFFDNLRDESKVFKNEASCIYRLLYSLIFLVFQSIRFFNWFSITTFIIFLVVGSVTLYSIFDDRIINLMIDKKKIQFWTSQDRIDKYEEKNVKTRDKAKVINFISVIVFIGSLIVGIIALKTTW